MKVEERYMMKRVLAIIMTITLVMGNSVGVLAAESVEGQILSVEEGTAKSGTCGESVTWTLENETLTISGNGEMADYADDLLERIPWYAYKEEIVNVVINEGVTKIGDSAFQGYSSIKSITIPESVRSIAEDAFKDLSDYKIYGKTGTYAEKFANENFLWFVSTGIKICTVIFDVNGGENLSETTKEVEYDKKIESFPIAEKNGSVFLGWYTDAENGELITKDTIIKDDITLYAQWGTSEQLWQTENDVLIKYKGYEKHVVIPDTVVAIGEEAFKNNDILESVKIPERVTSIGEAAFYGCKNLGSIEISETVNEIGAECFAWCTSLTDINIPNHVTEIDDGTFLGCSSLTSIVIPKSVTSIGGNAFSSCTNLASIVIPSSVSSMADAVFRNCKNLQIYGVAYSKANTYATENMIPFVSLSGDESAIYTVTFDANGGTDLIFSEKKVNANEKLGELPTVQREGWTFLGWYTAAGIRIDEYQFITSNMVVKAKWFSELKEITFEQAEIKIYENAKYILSYKTTPEDIIEKLTWSSSNEEVATVSKLGVVQAHKAGSAEITVTAEKGVSASCVVIVEKDETIVTSVEELQSQHPYLPNQNKTWIYTLDGAKFLKLLFSDDSETETNYDHITIYDKNDTVIGEYSGNELAGKEITVDGDTVKIRLKSDDAVQLNGFKVESITRDKTFYSVGFDANGGTNLSSNSVEIEENTSIGTLPTVERSGYVFAGWYTSKDGGTKVTEETVITGNTTLYAHWEKTYVSIEAAEIALSESSFVYDGTEKKPTVVVTLNGKALNPETDYVVNYENNIAVGTAIVTVTGKGDYTGTISKTFTIGTVSLENANVSLSTTSYIYDGKAKVPEVTVELNGKVLEPNKDYSIEYKDNQNVGTATVTIIGIGTYAGTKAQNFTISAANIKSAKVSLSTTSYTYNGKAKKPEVTVTLNGIKLAKNTEYTVSYTNNKNIGKAKVTIQGKGNYTGTITKTFTIKEKKGATFTVSKHKYKVTGSTTVAFTGVTSSSLKKVTVPKTVKYGGKIFKVTAVAKNALKKKTKVTTVTIGANVKTIGASAFEGCKKLSKVTIGSAVTTIGEKAFKNCTALKSIKIPSKVTKINKQAFYGCKNLKTIKITSTKLKTVGSQAFKGINAKATIKVPAKKLSAYKKLLKGKGQGSKVKIVK